MRNSITTLMFTVTFLTSPAWADKIDANIFFASDRVIEISIEIPTENWEKLCQQSRRFETGFRDPTEKPFTYFKGDVTIDGQKISSVGIRKKGFFGSLDGVRPSLKIKFDEYVKQDPFKGMDRITLNNNKQDASLVSQYVAYRMFAEAGIYAPRCNFARVTVNGTFLGIYSNVESIRKPFLKRCFGPGGGNLYEGTLADFYPKAVDRFEAKNRNNDGEFQKLMRVSQLLLTDESLSLEKLEEYIDIDYFIKFWAMESLIAFWDGYSANQNNYFLYENPKNNKFYFIPWGADSTLTGQSPFNFFGNQEVGAVYDQGILANRLYRAGDLAARYRETMKSLLDTVWNEDKILADVDRIEKLFSSDVHSAQRNGDHHRGRVRKFVSARREQIEDHLDNWPVRIAPQPRKPMYMVAVGEANGEFKTHWTEESVEKLAEIGSTTVALTLDGNKVDFSTLGIVARPKKASGFFAFSSGPRKPEAELVFTGIRASDQKTITLSLSIDRSAFEAGNAKTIQVSGSLREGAQRTGFGFNPGGQLTVSGELVCDKVSVQTGDPVVGKVNLKIEEMRGGIFGGRMTRPTTQSRPNTMKDALALFKKLDSNQDRKLDQTEAARSTRNLESVDGNADKLISFRELLDWFKKQEKKKD